MIHRITILMTEFITHDVKRFIVSKPETFNFTPGQGVELVIDKEKWRKEEGRPFTPTNLVSDHVLEFIIKKYPEHKGVTNEMHSLVAGDNLLMSDPFGTIKYKGPGVFIAAGAGITPFLSIFRELARKDNFLNQQLIFSNKTPADIICERELRHYFGYNCYMLCTRETGPTYVNERINQSYLEKKINKKYPNIYICGPDKFVEELNVIVKNMGFSTESIIYEE